MEEWKEDTWPLKWDCQKGKNEEKTFGRKYKFQNQISVLLEYCKMKKRWKERKQIDQKLVLHLSKITIVWFEEWQKWFKILSAVNDKEYLLLGNLRVKETFQTNSINKIV